MDINLSVIKSIKNAVIENGIELNNINSVQWDVCKGCYKFYIDVLPNTYYTMPNGKKCLNMNPTFNLKNMMDKSDVECVNEWLAYCDEHREELNDMVNYYRDCKQGVS